MSNRWSVRISKMLMLTIFSLCFALMGMQKNTYAASDVQDHWLQISTGYDHSIGVKADGTVWTWGNNDYGQLGTGTTGDHKVLPVKINVLKDVIAVGAGAQYSVAVKKDGTVWAWGSNSEAQLGDETYTKTANFGKQIITNNDKSTPVQVHQLTDIISVSAGFSKTYALGKDGSVWTWGGGSFESRDPFPDELLPKKLKGLENITAVNFGWSSTLALKSDNTLWIWGTNERGEMGLGTTDMNLYEPTQNTKLTDVISVSSGSNYNLAATKDGNVWEWGAVPNAAGGKQWVISTPTKSEGLSNVKAVAAGFGDSPYALKNDGTVWTWSGSTAGSNGALSVEAEQIKGLKDIVSIEAGGGWSRMFAIDKDGRAYGIGTNDKGQLGVGTDSDEYAPVQIGVDLTKPQPPVTPEPEKPAPGGSANTGDEPIIHAVVDGKQLTFEDQSPVKMNDRVLVPMRAIFTALGAEVTWNEETQTATGTKGSIVVSITVGSKTATINGKAFELDQPAVKLNDRTLVPVRFISEALNAQVGWNEDTSTVTITTK